MADFPTSPHSFASFSNGAASDAAQVTDIYGEVEAIETGYLNGAARLNSSHSTVAALSVAGGSTLAGLLTVGGRIAGSSGLSIVGNSTLGSSISLGTLPYVFPSSGGSTGDVLTIISTSGSTMGLEWRKPGAAPPTVNLTHDSTQALAASAFTGLNWNTERYDSTGMHSTATNSSRITFVESTGVYLVGAAVTVSTASGGNPVGLLLRVNDSSFATRIQVNSFDGVNVFLNVSAQIRVASTTDYVTAMVHVLSTAAVLAESTGTPTGFWACRVST